MLVLFLSPMAASADTIQHIPEPGTLNLLAIGAVALLASARRRRK